jgi:hypothetical protein
VTAFRVWIDGIEPAFSIDGDRSGWLATDGADGRFEELPLALLARLGLGPRPHPHEGTVSLPPGAMAILIGRRQAHGHGLPPAQAAALQRRLDAGVRHWSVRRADRSGRRRNLEVLEGGGGIWHVRPAGDLVELNPTTTTTVVRAIVALAGRQPQ